jgi:hypothetical protein
MTIIAAEYRQGVTIMHLLQGIKRLLLGVAVVCAATVAVGGAHAAPRHIIIPICFTCHLPPPTLLGVTYDYYYHNELDVFGDGFTPYTYARIVIADSVTGQVIRTDYDIVGEGGGLISIGSDGNAVDGTMIFYLPLSECGAYRNPQTGQFDPLSVQAFDGSTGLGSNVLYYQSGCV